MSSAAESAPLLETPPPRSDTSNAGAPVSRMGLVFAVLAGVAFFAVILTSSNVISLAPSPSGALNLPPVEAVTPGESAQLSSSERESLLKRDVDDIVSSLGKKLTPECRAEIIRHQRTFVNKLEANFANGCGGEQFNPLSLRDTVLEEQAHSDDGDETQLTTTNGGSACDQETLDHVFVKTFSRVYGWMCRDTAGRTLKMVVGFSTVPNAAGVRAAASRFTDDIKVRRGKGGGGVTF